MDYRLHHVHQQQDPDAFAGTANGGYLDYVVDRRFPSYWRAYVGQSTNLKARLTQHSTAIRHGAENSLHYYIVKAGGGERNANMIRLWLLPNLGEPLETTLILFNNVLEMTMCRAFQTLPPHTLKEAFGPQEYTGVGLNIVSPLLQGKELPPTARGKCISLLEASPDPEIRTWPQIRRKQKELHNTKAGGGSRMRSRRRVTAGDCYAALLAAIKDNHDLHNVLSLHPDDDPFEERQVDPVIDVDAWFGSTSAKLQQKTTTDSDEFVRPVGTPRALVAIILDRAAPTHSYEDGKVHLPFGLRESGFTESNSLIWTFDLRKFAFVPQTFQIAPPSPADMEVIRNSTRELLVQSNLRIILLCSRNAEMVAFGRESDEVTFSEITLKLHDLYFQAWLEIGNGKIQRMFIRSPAPVTSLWASNGTETYKLSTLFRFVATLSKISIFSGFYESALALALIIRGWDDEKNGRIEKATQATLEPTLQAWLAGKGFTDEKHFQRLEEAGGGSLRYGILILSHVLPRRAPEPGRNPRIPRSKEEQRDVMPKDMLNNVRSLFRELNPQGTPTSSERNTVPESTVLERSIKGDTIGMEEASADSVFEAIETGALPMDEIEEAEEEALIHEEFQEDPALQARSPVFRKRLELAIGSYFKGHEVKASPGSYSINIQHTGINFSAKPGHKEGFWVKAELTPPGIRNPNVWAKSIRNDDPGARLAFKVSIRDPAGKETFSCYPTVKTEKACCHANTIVDELCGDDLQAISKRARRYVYLDVKNDPKNYPGLEEFRGGRYTDDEGKPIRPTSKKRRGDESVEDESASRSKVSRA